MIVVVKLFERVSHVIHSYFIYMHVSQSQQRPVTNRVFKSEAKIRLGKMPFISKL